MKKFILIAVCLLLVALLTLGVCMYAIGENKDISKPYDMGSEITVTPPEDTPEAQKEMEKKFSVYNHVTEENGKKILTLFSEEQAEEQWTKRQSGENFRLTYDEILFLINDSARLYETYDEIVLTNSYAYGISELSESSLTGERIVSNKGDLTGLTYTAERSAYEKYSRDVTAIAAYRVAMLDSRMRKGYRVWHCASGIYAESVHLLFEDEVKKLVEGSSASPTGCIWTLIPDDLEWESEEAYRKALREQQSHVYNMWGPCEHSQVAYTSIVFSMGCFQRGFIQVPEVEDSSFAQIVGIRWGEPEPYESGSSSPHQVNLSGLLFPDKMLAWELKGSYLAFDEEEPADLYLWRNGGKYSTQLQALSPEEKASLQKRLGDTDGIVERYKTAAESYTVEEAGGYFLEVELGNGTSLLYPPLATYKGEYSLGCFVETRLRSYDTYENLSFRPCLTQEFVLELNSLTLPDYERLLPPPPVESMTGDVFVAWQTDTIPYLVLGEDGRGCLKGITDDNRVLPVKYAFPDTGRLYVWHEDESGEKQIRLVFREYRDGVYCYCAEESQGFGAYNFPDMALFYAYDRSFYAYDRS